MTRDRKIAAISGVTLLVLMWGHLLLNVYVWFGLGVMLAVILLSLIASKD